MGYKSLAAGQSILSKMSKHAVSKSDVENVEDHNFEAHERTLSEVSGHLHTSIPSMEHSSSSLNVSPETLDTAKPVELRLATAADLGLEEEDVPSDIQEFERFAFDSREPKKHPQHIVALCTVRMYNGKRSITHPEKQNIFNILKSLNALPTLTSIDSNLNIRGMLSNILGETSRPTKPYEYPEPLQRNAAIVRERFDSETASEAAQSTSPEPTSASSNVKKRRRPSELRPQTQRPLAIEDPTFKHVMRGIVISDGNRRVYQLDWDTRPPPRDCDIVGHNGLIVGQWWPLRACVRRDGAHGAIMAGIAGGAATGAYSIVISNEYADLDKDEGDILYYSGSNSHNNTDPRNPILSHSTKAMRLSYMQRRPIRVIRSGKANSRHAPSRGYRYDGLYTIVEEQIKQNKNGGAYMRFKMVRLSDQPPIDERRPDSKERQVAEALGVK